MALDITVPPGGRMLHKKVVEDPASGANRMIVTDQAQLEAAIKDGWALSAGDLADPKTSIHGTQRGPETRASAKAAGTPEPEKTDAKGIKVGGPDETVLDETVPDLTVALEAITDKAVLRSLKSKELKGRNRAGAIAAIEARIETIKEEQE
jgi:hypothetical protein